MPWLAPEGALSFRVPFATFASTGVVETRDLLNACLHENEGKNWLLRCPTRKAEDVILSLIWLMERVIWLCYLQQIVLTRLTQKRCRDTRRCATHICKR